MILDTPSKRRELLDRTRKVAMVGASDNPQRPSYFVFRYLITHGFDVKPINPNHKSLDGIRSYPTLQNYAQENGPPDVVDVFRKPASAVDIVKDAIAVNAKAIWFQYGIVNPEAIQLADQAGLQVVADRCMKVEHGRFHGGLSITGMDSGVLTSKRRKVEL